MHSLSLDLAFTDLCSTFYYVVKPDLFVCACIFDNDLCAHKWALANPPTHSASSSRMA